IRYPHTAAASAFLPVPKAAARARHTPYNSYNRPYASAVPPAPLPPLQFPSSPTVPPVRGRSRTDPPWQYLHRDETISAHYLGRRQSAHQKCRSFFLSQPQRGWISGSGQIPPCFLPSAAGSTLSDKNPKAVPQPAGSRSPYPTRLPTGRKSLPAAPPQTARSFQRLPLPDRSSSPLACPPRRKKIPLRLEPEIGRKSAPEDF